MEERRLPGPTREEITDYEFGQGVRFLVEDAIIRNREALSKKPINPVKKKELELASRLFLEKSILTKSELGDVLVQISKDYKENMQKNTPRGYFNALMQGFDYYLLTGLPIAEHSVLKKIEVSAVGHIKSQYVDLLVKQYDEQKDENSLYLENIDELVELGLGLKVVDTKELRLVKNKVLESLLKYIDLKRPSEELKGKDSLKYLKIMSTILYLQSSAVLYSEQGKTKLII